MDNNAYLQPQYLKDFKGYSVVAFGQMYFGIPKSYGAVYLEKIDYRMFPEIIVKPSLREVEDTIIEKWARSLDKEPPQLIRISRTYNIVAYQGMFFGVPRTLGEIRLEEIDLDGVPSVICKSSLEEMEDEIADRWVKSMPDGNPRLISNCGPFNIVFFKDVYFGIPQAWGDFRLEIGDATNKLGLIRDRTLQGAKTQIESRELSSPRSGVWALVVSVLGRILGKNREVLGETAAHRDSE